MQQVLAPQTTQYSWDEGINKAFASFMSDTAAFEKAVESSTRASWGGSGYSLELFPDGHWRVLWDEHIGNLYDSPGFVLKIPVLNDEDWDEDPSLRFYWNAEYELRDAFLDAIN